MANLKEIKGRITAIQSTRQVTRTMEMVSTAKIRSAQNKAEAAHPYTVALRHILSDLRRAGTGVAHPLLEEHPVCKRVMMVAVVSDRGQAGGFNAGIIHMVEQARARALADGLEVELVCYGRKAHSYFQYRGITPELSITGNTGSPVFVDAQTLAARVIREYTEGTLDRVEIFYNHFVNVARQVPEVVTLLPVVIEDEDSADEAAEKKRRSLEYIFDPSGEEVLRNLIPTYVEAVIFGYLLESAESEHGARRTAMKAATDNASDMIQTLTRSFNRARQSAITTEISEIVGGAAALEDN
ncbi:MAG: ATP synthase F1 subunit gamma [Actinomycetia bacterium]|nr:ATP synthase F1 subunit gamma [Actinomycetes bacterium]